MKKTLLTLAATIAITTTAQAQSSTLFQKINGDIGNKALSKAIKAYKADDLSSACFQASIAKISYLEAEFDKPYESALNFEKFVCNR